MFIEVKYQEQTRLSDLKWKNSVIPKGDKLLVVTKHQLYRDKDINMVPIPVFLIQSSYEDNSATKR